LVVKQTAPRPDGQELYELASLGPDLSLALAEAIDSPNPLCGLLAAWMLLKLAEKEDRFALKRKSAFNQASAALVAALKQEKPVLSLYACIQLSNGAVPPEAVPFLTQFLSHSDMAFAVYAASAKSTRATNQPDTTAERAGGTKQCSMMCWSVMRRSGQTATAPRKPEATKSTTWAALGWLRDVQERAVMLESRHKDGRITGKGYSWLQSAEFDPSSGIRLNFSGETIRITGRSLNAEARPNIRLFAGILRHRVPWIQEADGAAVIEAAKDALEVVSKYPIVFVDFAVVRLLPCRASVLSVACFLSHRANCDSFRCESIASLNESDPGASQ
jgi:hypothetical protein